MVYNRESPNEKKPKEFIINEILHRHACRDHFHVKNG